MAVAAIMASSVIVSDFRCISRARSLQAGASIGNTPQETRTLSSQVSSSSALAGPCSREISIPACISPIVTADTKSCSAGTSAIHSSTAPCGRGRRSYETTLVSRRYTGLVHDGRCSAAAPASRRRKVLSPSLRGQEQLLQIRSGHPLQPPPLLYGNKNGSFRSTPGHDLRPFGEGCIEILAEPSTWRPGPANFLS